MNSKIKDSYLYRMMLIVGEYKCDYVMKLEGMCEVKTVD